MEPTLLVEDYDLENSGYTKHYRAWFDVGGATPIHALIFQRKVGNRRELRWAGRAWIVEANGQTDYQNPVIELARSDMQVRDLKGDHTEEDRLEACRADAVLLAERMERIVGAIDKELLKAPSMPSLRKKK